MVIFLLIPSLSIHTKDPIMMFSGLSALSVISDFTGLSWLVLTFSAIEKVNCFSGFSDFSGNLNPSKGFSDFSENLDSFEESEDSSEDFSCFIFCFLEGWSSTESSLRFLIVTVPLVPLVSALVGLVPISPDCVRRVSILSGMVKSFWLFPIFFLWYDEVLEIWSQLVCRI